MKFKLPKIEKEALDALYIASKDMHPVSCFEQLGVSQRLINLLHANGINNVNELLQKKKEDLLSLQNFGEKQLQILFDAMSKYHLIEQ